MVYLNSPHAALNDSRTNIMLSMDYTIKVARGDTPDDIIDRFLDTTRRERLVADLVFNCHGRGGRLQMGTGITIAEVRAFRALRDKVQKIWFYACSPARGVAGHQFCSAVARNARAYVVASTEPQVETVAQVSSGLNGCLDTFEGLVLIYGPDGNIVRRRRFRSTWTDHSGNYAFANP
jgi:uncharacterized protein DUF4347